MQQRFNSGGHHHAIHEVSHISRRSTLLAIHFLILLRAERKHLSLEKTVHSVTITTEAIRKGAIASDKLKHLAPGEYRVKLEGNGGVQSVHTLVIKKQKASTKQSHMSAFSKRNHTMDGCWAQEGNKQRERPQLAGEEKTNQSRETEEKKKVPGQKKR